MTVDEVLANWRPRAEVIAREYERPGAPAADLAQEALIALWRAAEARPGDELRGLSTVVIRRAILRTLTHRRWTAEAEVKGKAIDPMRRADWRDVDEPDVAETLPPAVDELATVTEHAAVREAVRALPPADREYVFRRFWEDKTDADVARETGRSAPNLGRQWRSRIAPALRAHLDDAA